MELRLTGEEDAGADSEGQGHAGCEGGVNPQPACGFHFVFEIGKVFPRLGVEKCGDSLEVARNPLVLDKGCDALWSGAARLYGEGGVFCAGAKDQLLVAGRGNVS